MAFNINKLVIDRPIRGMMMNSEGDILWSVNDFKDPHLTASTEQQQALDALGTPIMEFDRAKTVEFTATNAGFDLALLSARGGVKKKIATQDTAVPAGAETITTGVQTPKWETISEVYTGASGEAAHTKTLAEVPVDGTINYIWSITGDGNANTRYELAEGSQTADATHFSIATSEGVTTITFPTMSKAGTVTFLVPYEYEAGKVDGKSAVIVDYDANSFPKLGRFVMSVLCHDVCDPETEYFAWMIMDNAKLNSEIDLTLNPEMTDDFTLKAMPAYCSQDKRCFRFIVPEVAG